MSALDAVDGSACQTDVRTCALARVGRSENSSLAGRSLDASSPDRGAESTPHRFLCSGLLLLLGLAVQTAGRDKPRCIEICQRVAEAIILLRIGELKPLLSLLSENLPQLAVGCQLRDANGLTCGHPVMLNLGFD